MPRLDLILSLILICCRLGNGSFIRRRQADSIVPAPKGENYNGCQAKGIVVDVFTTMEVPISLTQIIFCGAAARKNIVAFSILRAKAVAVGRFLHLAIRGRRNFTLLDAIRSP